MIFSLLENDLEEKIPKPLVSISTATLFDSRIALKNIKPERITEIENDFSANFANLSNGLIGTCYENVQQFKLIPGHRAFIEKLPHKINAIVFKQHSTDFTQILKLLIESAENYSYREGPSLQGNQETRV